jgi:hypothetical protein
MKKLALITKKDYLSNVAGVGIFAGLVIVAACNFEIIDNKYKKYGEFLGYIGGTATALLVGKNPGNLKISDTTGICTDVMGKTLPDGRHVKYGESLLEEDYKTVTELVGDSIKDAISKEDIPKIVGGTTVAKLMDDSSKEEKKTDE